MHLFSLVARYRGCLISLAINALYCSPILQVIGDFFDLMEETALMRYPREMTLEGLVQPL